MPTPPKAASPLRLRPSCTAACLLATLLALVGSAVFAVDRDAEELDSLVDRYVEALQRSDIPTLEELWTEDVVLIDPTAGSRTEGRAALASALAQSSRAFQSLSLDVKTRFISNNHAVLIYEGTAVTLPRDGAESFTIHSPGVMVLRVEDGRIAEHTDYVDYSAVHRQMAARPAATD